MTSSCHRCLGLPTGLVPKGLTSNSFPAGLARSIRCICPSHLILCALMNLTISAPSINLSICMLFRILHILSILTGPNILIFAFQKMRRLLGLYRTMIKFAPARNCSVCAYTCTVICFNKPGVKPVVYVHDTLTLRRRIKSHLLFAGIIRSSPFSLR